MFALSIHVHIYKSILKAYAFQTLEGDRLRVLNWIASTPFTLASYRRCNATPTSRSNTYIEVSPKVVYSVGTYDSAVSQTTGRKRSHEKMDTPPPMYSDSHSAG